MDLTTPDPVYPGRTLELAAETFAPWTGQKRAVILVPPLGGLTWADRFLAWRLRRAGAFVVALTKIEGDHYGDDDWRVHDRGLRRGRAAVTRLIDWVRASGCERVSLVGASMGALFGAMAASHADVDRTALIVAGDSCAEIAARSRHPRLRALKRTRCRREALDDEGYLRRLRQSFTVDIDAAVGPRPGRRDLVIIGQRDQIVPTRNQWRLARLLRPEGVLRVPHGHLLTIVFAQLFLAGRLVRHLT